MEKQSTLASYLIKRVIQPSLGIFAILKEAFTTSIRNGRHMLFIISIMFSYYFTMMGLADYVVLPSVFEVLMPVNATSVDADSIAFKTLWKTLPYFLTYQFVVLSFLILISMFSEAASVHSTCEATCEAYTAKLLSIKEILSGNKERWKRALITSLCMIQINLTSAALLCFMFVLVAVMTEGSVSSALYWTLLILAGFGFVYLCALWMLGLVVSVMEENLSGQKAITEANELMKGNRGQGFVLMVLMILAGAAISKAFYLLATTVTPTQNAKLAMVVDLTISIPKDWLYCGLQLFGFVVYTVFYHQCKKSKAVEEKIALYAPISAVAEFEMTLTKQDCSFQV